jgi:hypothetical protein
MNLIWLRLIFKRLIFVYLIGFGPMLYGQEMPESYIFYSPSEEQMGSLTVLGENSRMFSNSERLLLLDSNNFHQDTLELGDWANGGIVQDITVLNDSLFSISFMREFGLISFKNNRFTVIKRSDIRSLRKKGIKFTNMIFLPDGYLGINIKYKKRQSEYEFEFYDKSFDFIKSRKVKLEHKEKNDFSSSAISYPHQYYINRDGELCLSSKQSKSFFMMDLNSLKIRKLDLSKEVDQNENIEVFYNRVGDQYYLVKYIPQEGPKTQLRIYDFNKSSFETKILNDCSIPLNQFSGGFIEDKIIFWDKFKGDYAIYLVPIEDLHKI